MKYDDSELIEEYDSSKYSIQLDKLLIIGICQRGNLLMYCGEEAQLERLPTS